MTEDYEEIMPNIRDFIAGQALMGLIASKMISRPYEQSALAYEFADAMLETRNKKAKKS